ncbi:3523_t:CDS:1 [Acaulospora colombiana]|uniref:3523_t:CDS:1 n=1 Tax=Acaulospora colombiana TaxID=27376 RepID=A0ACA9K1E6_9GLOM|nr:3523_t:CDS:1 [Acaulospora colombiana]
MFIPRAIKRTSTTPSKPSKKPKTAKEENTEITNAILSETIPTASQVKPDASGEDVAIFQRSSKNSPERGFHSLELAVLPEIRDFCEQPTHLHHEQTSGPEAETGGKPVSQNDQDAVKEYSHQQRTPLNGEPVCVVWYDQVFVGL